MTSKAELQARIDTITAAFEWYDNRPEGKVWCPSTDKWAEIVHGRCGYEGCKECGLDYDYETPHEGEADDELIRRIRAALK